MGRPAKYGVIMGLLWTAAATAAPHGSFVGPGVAPRAPQIMLYFSQSMGSATGATRPTLGLKVQQVRQAGNSGDPQAAGDPVQQRELLNWQMEAHSGLHISDLRVQLGRRLTYDLTNRKFGSPEARPAMQIGTPPLRTGLLNASDPMRSLAPDATASPAPTRREAAKDNSNIRELAVAAMSALAPASFTSAQRQTAQRRGGVVASAGKSHP